MGKHTQGPWILGTYDHASYNVTGPKGEMPFIAKIPAGRKESERLANAFLIASAPDLLAVCEKIKAHGTISATWIDELDAAIAKARGQ